MQKIIRFNDITIAILSNGESYQKTNITDDEYNSLCKATSDEEVLSIMCPTYKAIVEDKKSILEYKQSVLDSKILTLKNDAVYWEDVSMLSMPRELVQAVLDAEWNKEDIKLDTYRNFWTLMSLNPDEQCRLNLFWFLTKYGLKISRCGFFVAYRNVDKHKEYTEENPIYTDRHTHTFKIKIGEMVTMDRSKCDSNQDVTCSSGLHCAGAGWLKRNYYGNVGLITLVNPAEVVAVPREDNYGKLRCCAYLPIAKAVFDDEEIVPYNVEDGFECEYVPKVIYEGLMGTEKDTNYKIVIPDIPGINKQSMADKLLDIARETIINRNI